MPENLRILFVDDSENDVFLIVREIKKGGFDVDFNRVETPEALRSALNGDPWDLVIIDYVIPNFGGPEALKILQEYSQDIPSIVTSGIVAEDIIVETLHAGAFDYILKNNLTRLVPAIRATLQDAENLREKRWQQEEIQRLYKELSIKYEVADICLSIADKDMYGEVLDIVLREMKSRFGVFGFLNDRGEFVCPSMTRDVWDVCQIPDKDIVLPPEKWGSSNWGESLRTGQVTFSNMRSSVPVGHIDIERSLNVPINHHGQTIGLLMVANKDSDYDQGDIALLKMIADHLSPILNARLETARESYKRERSETKYRTLYDSTSDAVMVLNQNGFIDCNNATIKMFGGDIKKDIISKHPGELSPMNQPCGAESSFLANEQISAAMETGSARFEWIHKRLGTGEEFPAEVLLSRMIIDNDHVLQATVRDITERKKMEFEREHLLDKMKEKADQNQALLDSARAILEENEFKVTARKIFDSCRKAIGGTSGYVALLSEDGMENKVLFLEAGGLPCSVNPDSPMPIRGLREEAYRLGMAVCHNDFHNSEHAEYLPSGHVELRNVLFAPLNISAKTVGIMGIANKPGDFSEKDKKLAEGFGELAAIALRNSMAREALRESEERYRSVSESINIGVSLIGKNMEILTLNRKMKEWFPLVEESTNPLCYQAFNNPPRENPCEYCPTIKTLSDGQIHESITTIPTENGIRHYRLQSSPVLDSRGKVVAATELVEDITDQVLSDQKLEDYSKNLEKMVEERTQQLEDALRITEQGRDRTDAILKSVADGLLVTDNRNNVILMNHAAEDALGIRFSDVYNRPIQFAIEDASLSEKFSYTLNKQQTGYEFDLTCEQSKNSADRIMRGRTSVIVTRDGSVSGVVTLIQDVTKEREIDRMKTEFISTAAHELRTPLTSIRGFSEILLMRDNISQEDQKKYLGYIQKQSVSLANIINDLLDISRIESGKGFQLNKKRCDGRTAIKAIVTQFQEISEKHSFVTVWYEKPVDLWVDLDKMEQVLQNLLSNAVKYSPNGGTITIKTMVKDDYFIICVQDEGMGMTQDQVSHIFDKFYRADASNTAIEGTGLGMSIVKYIVEAHKGKIHVSSQKNVGTEVKILLPLKNV